MTSAETTDARFIEAAFWIVLERAPGPVELRDQLRAFGDHERHWLPIRLLSSPEGQHRIAARRQSSGYVAKAEIESGLARLGTNEWFVTCAYQVLFGRQADAGGLAHFTGVMAAGEPRCAVVRNLIVSEEFVRHFTDVAPQAGRLLRDTQLCELANPAKWDNDEWLGILRSLGQSDDKLAMHRKAYEFSQLVYGCRRLGVLRDDASFVSIGAGHEDVLYWLANRVSRVVATDMYEGAWSHVQSREGDEGVIRRPEDYAPYAYRRDHLAFLKMDARQLAFTDGVFDVAYSLSSIEHFGGVPGAVATVREMARVLKPGGILALATEYVIAGPPHEETFQPDEFAEVITQPGLRLVEPLDTTVYRRYEYAAVDLYRNPYQTPHMVVRFNDTVFTTVMVFLEKQ
jgi:SAM-dependent methyltransferase